VVQRVETLVKLWAFGLAKREPDDALTVRLSPCLGVSLLRLFIGKFEVEKDEFLNGVLPTLETEQSGHDRNNEAGLSLYGP